MLLNAKLLNVLRCFSMKIMKMKMKIRKNEDRLLTVYLLNKTTLFMKIFT